MTRLLAYAEEALQSLWRNRTRSALSMLGMVIGIASVIGVLGLSQAASNGIRSQIESGGDPGFIAVVDRAQDDPTIATLYYRDVDRMVSLAGGAIARAIPYYQDRPYRVTSGKKSDVIGVTSTEAIKPSSGIVMLAGRAITAADVAGGANVCMFSQKAAETLYPAGNALGQAVNVGSARLQIVGVFTVSGSLFNSVVAEAIYVPYTTMHRIAPGPIDFIQLWAPPGAASVPTIEAAKKALSRIHSHAQYTVQDQGATLGIFENVLAGMGAGLTVIGGIALFVAGVGIMNIMLVSVNERTREIGIRKSIGASAGDIGFQFLIEATLLSLAGGAIGTLAGVAIVLFGIGPIRASVGTATVPWLTVIGIAVAFSVTIGIGFGWYPASRAGRLDPVEALRS